MGNDQSSTPTEYSNCHITKDGEHVTTEEIFEAGAAQARLEDTESPGPIGDAIATLVYDRDVNWNATPDNIEGPCDEH